MRKLTTKEEEAMNLFWEKGPLCVREMLEFYDEPRPHFNTLSTVVRTLEDAGFVGHQAEGKSYRYFARVSRADYSQSTLQRVISKYFNNSCFSLVSALVKKEELSVDELKALIAEVEKGGES